MSYINVLLNNPLMRRMGIIPAEEQSVPSQGKAKESADEEIKRRRKIKARTGGRTLLTTETLGNTGSVSSSSLLGT